MADYQKMYAVLCSAVDEVIDPLERIPLALSSAEEEPEPPRVRESTIEILPPKT